MYSVSLVWTTVNRKCKGRGLSNPYTGLDRAFRAPGSWDFQNFQTIGTCRW